MLKVQCSKFIDNHHTSDFSCLKSQDSSLTLSFDIHFSKSTGRRQIKIGLKPNKPKLKIPILRIAKLLALAHHLDGLIKSGIVKDYADIARLGRVSRPRVTQIMNLLLLPPDIQETILNFPPQGHEIITERKIRHILKEPEWEKQLKFWNELLKKPKLSNRIP